MGVYEGRGQLAKGIQALKLKWQETKMSWDDKVSANFQETFLVSLEVELRRATSAMDTAAQALSQARRDCQ